MSVAELNNLITTTITVLNQLPALLTQVTQTYVYLNDFLGLLWNAVSAVTGFVGHVTGSVNSVVQFFAGLL